MKWKGFELEVGGATGGKERKGGGGKTHLTQDATIVLKNLGHSIQQLNGRGRGHVEARGGSKQQAILAHKQEIEAVEVEDRRSVSPLPELDLAKQDLGCIWQGVPSKILLVVHVVPRAEHLEGLVLLAGIAPLLLLPSPRPLYAPRCLPD